MFYLEMPFRRLARRNAAGPELQSANRNGLVQMTLDTTGLATQLQPQQHVAQQQHGSASTLILAGHRVMSRDHSPSNASASSSGTSLLANVNTSSQSYATTASGNAQDPLTGSTVISVSAADPPVVTSDSLPQVRSAYIATEPTIAMAVTANAGARTRHGTHSRHYQPVPDDLSVASSSSNRTAGSSAFRPVILPRSAVRPSVMDPASSSTTESPFQPLPTAINSSNTPVRPAINLRSAFGDGRVAYTATTAILPDSAEGRPRPQQPLRVIINAADANLRQYLNDTLRAREQQTTVLVPTDGDALVDNLLGLPTAPSVVVINGNDCLTTVDRVRQLGMNNLTVIAITASGEHSDQTYLTAGASAVLSDTTSPTVMVDVILSAADQPHTAYVAR